MPEDPRELLEKADRAAASSGGIFSFFGGGSEEKYENAVDLYRQAASAFGDANQFKEAGLAYEREANIRYKHLSDPVSGANSLLDAFNVYSEHYPEDAVRVIDVVIEQHKAGSLARRAGYKAQQAGVYKKMGDQKRALEAYEQAAGWYRRVGSTSIGNSLYLQAADLTALEGDYLKAIGIFEKVAGDSIYSNTMKWSVKDYFLKAGICWLAAGDTIATQKALEKYREMDRTFASTREHQLLVALAEAVENGDQKSFDDKILKYDDMSKLDSWKTAIFLKIQNAIKEKEDDFS